MNKYKSHKTVYAGRIISIEDGEVSYLELETGERFSVSYKWYTKHSPEVGGYFVQYEDGYESYSPANAFELGYTQEL